jgi:hypothetical protein
MPLKWIELHGEMNHNFHLENTIMVYTDQSIRFTTSEIAVYRSTGVDVAQIKTYRQFAQMVHRGVIRMHGQPTRKKENHAMVKRFGRYAMNGTMEYYDTYAELLAAQKREYARVRTFCFGLIGLIAGGMLAYALLLWMQVDSKMVRFAGVIVGIWFGGVLAASLSALLWMILKWALGLTVIAAIGLFIFLAV